ncbi:MAG: hypothetical protein ACI9XO_000144 [Paraglaciecola sp.]|jgi:hypothetical protein
MQMKHFFYFQLFYFLSLFLLPANGFAVTEQRNSTQAVVQQRVKIKKQKGFAKIMEKIKKLKEKKAWFLIGLSIFSALTLGLITLTLTGWLVVFIVPVVYTGIGIQMYFFTRKTRLKGALAWLITPIVINLGIAIFAGIIVYKILSNPS